MEEVVVEDVPIAQAGGGCAAPAAGKVSNLELAKLISSYQNQSSSELAETKTQMMVYKEKAEQAAVIAADKAQQVVVLAADKEHLTKRSHELELEASVAIECKRMKTEVL